MATIAKQQKIKPCLWFDGNAEEAVKFYIAVFKNSKIVSVSHYGDGASFPKGTALMVSFKIAGQEFLALNGGPHFKFNESVSFVVNCATQKEIDYFWDTFTKKGGQESMCGWLKDKYGLSWQIVPANLGELMSGKTDKAKAGRTMQALLKMKKLDIKTLKNA